VQQKIAKMNKRTKEENNPDLTPPNVEKWLLSCDQCQKKAHLMADAKYAWAVIASCKKCGSWWTYCRVCSKQKIKYEKSAQRSNHHNQKHSGQVLPASRIPEEQHFTPQKKREGGKRRHPTLRWRTEIKALHRATTTTVLMNTSEPGFEIIGPFMINFWVKMIIYHNVIF
jgi:hypothetical protein